MLFTVRGVANLTKDGTIRTTAQGRSCIALSLATNERRKDGNDKAHYFDANYWVKSEAAEKICSYLVKGVPLDFEGNLMQDSYEKDGQKRTKVYINIRNFSFVERKGSGSAASTSAPASESEKSIDVNSVKASVPMPGPEMFDDDIPF